MFADDFVGLTTNAEETVQEFCNKQRLKSNIKTDILASMMATNHIRLKRMIV